MNSKTPETLAAVLAIVLLSVLIVATIRAIATPHELREAAAITQHVTKSVTAQRLTR